MNFFFPIFNSFLECKLTIPKFQNYSEIEIISNCSFFRPIVLNYKKNYIDVHHG